MSILGYNPRADCCRLFQKVGVQFQECSTSLKIPKLKWNTNVADDR